MRHVSTLLQTKEGEKFISELPFESVCSTMAELVHFGQVSSMSKLLEEQLEKMTTVETINSAIKLLGTLSRVDNALESYEKLLKNMEIQLRKQEVFDLIPIKKQAELVFIFAEAYRANFFKYNIMDKLILNLEKNFESLEEKEVIQLINAYKSMNPSVVANSRMFFKITDTVSKLAVENIEMVNASFLMNYLSAFYDLPKSRQLTKEQNDSLVEILEEKIQAIPPHTMGNNMYMQLAKILSKSRHADKLKSIFLGNLEQNGKKLGFDDWKIVLFVLKAVTTPE